MKSIDFRLFGPVSVCVRLSVHVCVRMCVRERTCVRVCVCVRAREGISRVMTSRKRKSSCHSLSNFISHSGQLRFSRNRQVNPSEEQDFGLDVLNNF